MIFFEGLVPKKILNYFRTDIGSGEFFSYVGNLVSIEQAIAVTGILSPDFVEYNDCIFWRPNCLDKLSKPLSVKGFVESENGNIRENNEKKNIERYQNNFSVSHFFSRWEDSPDILIQKFDLSDNEYKLCFEFAHQIEIYWKSRLNNCFPDKEFKFEISDNILDEYGVCLTFWQI